MSRLFDDASSQHCSVDVGIVTAVPLSVYCLARCDDATITQTVLSLCNSASVNGDDTFRIQFAGAVAGDPIRFISADTGQGTASTSTGYTAGTWHSILGVTSATNSRAVYIDGGSKGTNTGNRTPVGINRFVVSGQRQATSNQFFSGDVAEVALWDTALDDNDALMLADFVSPLLIRPANLVGYWQLFGNTSPEIDLIGGNALTVSGATKSDHSRVILPSRPRLILPDSAAPAATPKNLLLLGVGV